MTVNNTDTFLVERSGTSYKLQAQNLMADLQDNDLMLVERSGTSYKATGLDIKNSLGSDQPTYKANASGAITSGEAVVVNSDGTISGIDSTSYSLTGTLATNRLQGEGDKESNPIVYDPAQDRVIAVRDDGNLIRLKIGRLNNSTTITWGNWTTVYTSSIQIRNKYTGALWDADSGQIVIFFYTNQSGYYKANLIVRAISSSDSITGSSHDVFNFGAQYPSITRIPCMFKSEVESTLIHVCWQKHGSGSTYYIGFTSYQIGSDSITKEDDTNIATANQAFWAGTQSDGTIVVAQENTNQLSMYTCSYNTSSNALGTRTTSNIDLGASYSTPGNTTQIAYDSSRNGWWIASRYPEGSNNFAQDIRGGFFTVNGSGQCVLSAAKYCSAISGPEMFLVYHPPSRTAILAHGGNHPHEQSVQMGYIQLYFDSNGALQSTKTYPLLKNGTHTIGARSIDRAFYVPNKKQIMAFHIDAYWEGLSHFDRDSNFFNPAYTDTNLTSTNFLGFADGAYANGVEAKAIVYPGVASGQSGLTTGTKYYVQMDGTLDTTADDISQVAGVAQSATTIKVQYS